MSHYESTPCRSHSLLLLTASLLAVFNDQSCCGVFRYSIHVEGTLAERREPIGHGSPETTLRQAFTVDVEDRKWFIELRPLNPDYSTKFKMFGTNKVYELTPDAEIASSDGDSFYTYALADTHAQAMIARGDMEPGKTGFSFAVRRGPGNVPYAMANGLVALWYAFASQEYFRTAAATGALPPMQQMPDTFYFKTNFLVSAQWQLLSEPPGLPTFILSSNTDCCTHTPRDSVESFLLPRPPNTNVVLETVNTLRVGGHLVPSELYVRIHYFSNFGRSVANPLGCTLHLSVDKAQPTCRRVDFTPRLSGRGQTLFSDISHWADKGVTVVVPLTNANLTKWPGAADVNDRASRLTAGKVGLRHANVPQVKLVIFLALAILAAPVCFVIGRNLTNRQINKSRNQSKGDI